ncbi:unnamed protein product [Heligmosomoides polygyrus]|uniref:RING-type domain-containing protein n=1 Tax=Heligmosomoides polygyrus TaxID=6339 RepID=A0A3P8DU55_HELPZ|nr:unnamed protein product [Heligmosomoides polygyrus]
MWSASEALSGLVPNCSCGAAYDLRFYAPHSLPCAHTFCLTCLSKEKQIKKRRCPSCRKKYSSFILNLALADQISSSNGKDVSRKTSLAKRLSGLIRSVTGSQSSLIKPVYQAGPGSSQSSGVSSGVSSDDQKETSLYQRISLQLPSRPASCVAISEGCMGCQLSTKAGMNRVNMEDMLFVEPDLRITSIFRVHPFTFTEGYRDLTGFIREVNQAVIGVRTSDSVSIPAASSSLLGIFDVLKVSRCFDIHF